MKSNNWNDWIGLTMASGVVSLVVYIYLAGLG